MSVGWRLSVRVFSVRVLRVRRSLPFRGARREGVGYPIGTVGTVDGGGGREGKGREGKGSLPSPSPSPALPLPLPLPMVRISGHERQMIGADDQGGEPGTGRGEPGTGNVGKGNARRPNLTLIPRSEAGRG